MGLVGGSGRSPLLLCADWGYVLSGINPALHRRVLGKGSSLGTPRGSWPHFESRWSWGQARAPTMWAGVYRLRARAESHPCSTLEPLSPEDWEGLPAPLASGLLEGTLVQARLPQPLLPLPAGRWLQTSWCTRRSGLTSSSTTMQKGSSTSR